MLGEEKRLWPLPFEYHFAASSPLIPAQLIIIDPIAHVKTCFKIQLVFARLRFVRLAICQFALRVKYFQIDFRCVGSMERKGCLFHKRIGKVESGGGILRLNGCFGGFRSSLS